MKIRVIVHEAEEGGYWAELPELPGCAAEGETLEALIDNLREAIRACISENVLSSYMEPVALLLEVDSHGTSSAFLRLLQMAREEIVVTSSGWKR